MIVNSSAMTSLADLMSSLGDVPFERIRLHPPIGTATVRDVIRIHDKEDRLCELVFGVLIEKTSGLAESALTVYLASILHGFVRLHNLGVVLGADGMLRILPRMVRIPDISFLAWDKFPDRKIPRLAVPSLAPNLAVEVLSKGNTRKEMAIKRQHYFEAGVELVWEVDPKKRSVAVYASENDVTVLTIDDTLDGGTVLPGFQLAVRELFAELDRHG